MEKYVYWIKTDILKGHSISIKQSYTLQVSMKYEYVFRFGVDCGVRNWNYVTDS